MSSLKRFWRAIEALPTHAAVEAEWIALVRGVYNRIKPFLLASKDRADSHPNVHGGLPYRVVEHGPDDFVGVCPETGETVPIQKKQLVVYHLAVQQLARQVASALGLNSASPVDASSARLFMLGSLRLSGASFATFLTLPRDPADVLDCTATLISSGQTPFLLLTPTRRFVTADVELRLRSLGSAVLSLEESLTMSEEGQWVIGEEAIRIVLPDRPVAEEPLSERAQEVLVAMLQLNAVDSDRKQPTAEIAVRAMGSEADANSLKKVISDLANRKLVETRRGRGHGCWLTEAGRLRAERLSHLLSSNG